MMLFGSVLRWHVTRPAYAHKEGLMSGKYFDDLIPGTHYHHPLAHTITETENSLFCNLTRNTQPLHLDAEFAKKTQYGQRIVNGLFTLSLVVGLSVPDLTEGTLIANLGYDKIVHPNPVFLNDTLSAETEVLDKWDSTSKLDRGIVRLKQTGRKQDGSIVVELERTVMFLKRPIPEPR
jgi:acyl dehydratase